MMNLIRCWTVLLKYIPKRMVEAYQGIQRHLTDELPVISLYFRTGSMLVDDRSVVLIPLRMDTFRNIKSWFLAR